MWPAIVAGGLLATAAVYAWWDSRKLRIGDTALVPVSALGISNFTPVADLGPIANAPFGAFIQLADILSALKQRGGDTKALVTKRTSLFMFREPGEGSESDAIDAVIDASGSRLPVTFKVRDVKSFERNGVVHKGGV